MAARLGLEDGVLHDPDDAHAVVGQGRQAPPVGVGLAVVSAGHPVPAAFFSALLRIPQCGLSSGLKAGNREDDRAVGGEAVCQIPRVVSLTPPIKDGSFVGPRLSLIFAPHLGNHAVPTIGDLAS